MVYLAMNGQPTRGEKVAKHEGISKKYPARISHQPSAATPNMPASAALR